jgi:hypothetical protein
MMTILVLEIGAWRTEKAISQTSHNPESYMELEE